MGTFIRKHIALLFNILYNTYMTQDIDTQELSDTLEKIIQRRNSWYTPRRCDWDTATFEDAVDTTGYYAFFPREIADTIPLDDSYKDRVAIARRWYRSFISEKDDEVVNIYEVYKTWPTLKDDIFQVVLNEEFVATCVEIEDFKVNPQLEIEVNGLKYMLFTSADMVERFIKKNCLFLNSCIERWKLLTELKEHSREVCVAKN